MALQVIKGRYAREADELADQLKKRGVILTENSHKLLRVAVQGWYEEPPDFVSASRDDREFLKTQLWRIVDHAADEHHVAAKKESGEKVAFTDFFAGLFESGRDVVGQIIKKGF